MPPPTPLVGIDLGTTFSVVAHLDSLGRPVTLLNAEGDLTTPSVVFFEDSNIVVGKEAVKAGLFEPDRVAQLVKREMGNPLFSKSINGEFYPPEVVQSLILEKLKQDAQARLGPFEDVVITVPAYFNEPRRKATQDAGRLAGLKVVDIINEPTAAAIAHGFQQGFLNETGESKQPEKVIVYDLGGGTFDVTLMDIEGKNFTVLATDGDVKLGGVDWDGRIVDWIAEEFDKKYKVDPRKSPAGMQRLMREAEDAKRALSAREKVTIGFEHEGRGLRLNLSRAEFENMTADLLERTRFTVSSLLRTAGSRWSDVTRVLLVGGSTRMPMVPRMLEQEAGKPVDVSLSVDEAVAHGAAIYAGLLRSAIERPRQAAKITNVNSHSLGVLAIESATGRPRNQVLIPTNHPLPATHSKRFRTAKVGQKSVVINVIEGGDASGNHCTPIGKCVVRDLPPDLPAGTAVHVTFDYSNSGRLTVHASLPDVGRAAHMDFERASGLTESKLKEWDIRIKAGFQK